MKHEFVGAILAIVLVSVLMTGCGVVMPSAGTINVNVLRVSEVIYGVQQVMSGAAGSAVILKNNMVCLIWQNSTGYQFYVSSQTGVLTMNEFLKAEAVPLASFTDKRFSTIADLMTQLKAAGWRVGSVKDVPAWLVSATSTAAAWAVTAGGTLPTFMIVPLPKLMPVPGVEPTVRA